MILPFFESELAKPRGGVYPAPVSATGSASETESIVIRLGGRKHAVGYQPGDTILEAARRGGLSPPFQCQMGDCATCMAFLVEGAATMRANNALEPDEVAQGWILTCQAVPASREVVVDYDR
jgi:ferredoxin